MFIPGDYKMVCDRCGGVYRRSEMREEWTGAWVCLDDWNPRHPLDLIESIPDDPSVEVARPDVLQPFGETTLYGAITEGATTATLTSATGLNEGDGIGISMDNGIVFWTYLTDDPDGNDIEFGSQLHFAAASGNTVYLPTVNTIIAIPVEWEDGIPIRWEYSTPMNW